MNRSVRRRLGAAIGTLVILVSTVVLGTTQPAQAAAYDYKPGHPMMRSPNVGQCTGSWVVVGASGSFFLTAGHCDFPGIPGQEWTSGLVYGTSTSFGHFGSVRRDDDTSTCNGVHDGEMDLQLIQPRANLVGSYQIVSAGNVEGGRVVGRLSNSRLDAGGQVGKYGRVGGSSVGTLRGTSTWCSGERVYLADYRSSGGDSGGPVYVNDGQGRAWAAGVHVGRIPINNVEYAAFISIDDALARFGAQLPVFSSLAEEQEPPLHPGEPLRHMKATEFLPD
ncbi:S1 family peptidase [Paractinoplanes maris]|uniref:S1 family peptidase n=1 Tax=Paractinoplanes maris TaxID=1734446 RepID=UPI002021AE38|nr:S1 family peptidase [Actinoplanes maris]